MSLRRRPARTAGKGKNRRADKTPDSRRGDLTPSFALGVRGVRHLFSHASFFHSAVSFAPMFDSGDAEGVAEFMEAEAVVGDAGAELRGLNVLEALHIAFAGFEIAAKAWRMRRAVG